MRHYFYHGFEGCSFEEDIIHMIDIIKSGEIKKRSEVRGNNELSHICLYRKNEEFDYNNELNKIHQSARAGWIDNCMVFVISDDIEAKYLPPNVRIEGLGLPTNLVDEWRCLENIPLSKIIGIAIPLDSLKKVLKGEEIGYSEEEVKKIRESLIELKGVCSQIGLKVYNSEEENFTDKLDAELQKEKTSESKSIQYDEEIK